MTTNTLYCDNLYTPSVFFDTTITDHDDPEYDTFFPDFTVGEILAIVDEHDSEVYNSLIDNEDLDDLEPYEMMNLVSDYMDIDNTELDPHSDNYYPQMSLFYAVTLPHDADPSEVASAVYAVGNTILLKHKTLGYGIALTGGGMDLSDYITRAYVACGCAAPIWLALRALKCGGTPNEATQDAVRRSLEVAKDSLSCKLERVNDTLSTLNSSPSTEA